ncbi:MAG TPA: non-homologous end-joining DNA ligase [Thermoleophilia bacterium]|nr:non-homologous end-joining DNA ligase [Thermoleophilia bacterium]
MANTRAWGGLPSIAPMLATLGQLPPDDLDRRYGYEVKWDGVRAVAYLAEGQCHLVSRNDHDITVAYPELDPPAHLTKGKLILDGEIVAFDEHGKPSFAALQPRMHLRDPARIARRREANPVAYIVFDVMHRDGRDLTGLTYKDRREVLKGLNVASAPAWRTSDYRVGGGAELYRATKESGLEGIIAKRLDSPYLAGRRSPDWIKIKHVRTQEVVIGGWTEGEGRRQGGVGALLLGIPGEKGLDFVGHVGTGFTEDSLADLGKRLAKLKTDSSPFAKRLPAPTARAAHWVRPKLVGEVVYAERTRDGLLRTPAWRGLRPDKEPRDVRPE